MVFFFFKQKTAYEMRISDWSSDVCSSDLTTAASLQVLISDTTALATASSDGTSNGNLLNIHSIRGTTGAENGWTQIISAHGTLLTSTLSEEKAASARDQQARAARENVSGVDLDVEAAE